MTQPIRVLQLAVIDLSVAKLLLPLIRGLQQAGFEVEAACADGPYARDMRANGLVVHPLSFVRRGLTWRHLVVFVQLLRLMRRRRFDVLHTHTTLASVIGRVAGRLAGIPVIVHTAHGFRFHEHRHPLINAALIRLESIMGRHFTDYLFTVSGEDQQVAMRRRIVAPGCVERINSVGVDARRFGPSVPSTVTRAELNLRPDDRVVGFVGRLVREKGVVELITAMRTVVDGVPSARLLVVGDTLASDRDRGASAAVRAEVDRLGLREHVIFAGFRDDVAAMYRLMHVFVLPSWREGMPVTVIEAMASGLPVVATDIRGCREEVVNGVTGYLVPRQDAPALGQAILRLVSDSDLARTMGEAGRQRAVAEFDESIVVAQQVAAYRRLIEQRHTRGHRTHGADAKAVG